MVTIGDLSFQRPQPHPDPPKPAPTVSEAPTPPPPDNSPGPTMETGQPAPILASLTGLRSQSQRFRGFIPRGGGLPLEPPFEPPDRFPHCGPWRLATRHPRPGPEELVQERSRVYRSSITSRRAPPSVARTLRDESIPVINSAGGVPAPQGCGLAAWCWQ